MGTTLRHIVIPVKDLEELHKARDFFVNVIGLRLQKEGEAKTPKPKMNEVEADRRLPSHYCHIVDENGLKIDLVAYDDGIVSYGKGVVIGFNVDDINATWDTALKGGSVRPIFDPISYPEWLTPTLGHKEAYFAFMGLQMGRISNDGEEQIIELVEHRQ
jgi:catechol 2,3-dioxygenase-like lactoylglutathione lyase family enzyme